jgi:hypothetical protein
MSRNEARIRAAVAGFREPGFAERLVNSTRTETPLEAYYRRVAAIRKGDKTIWEEINRLHSHDQAIYRFFQRYGDKTFEQIVGRV